MPRTTERRSPSAADVVAARLVHQPLGRLRVGREQRVGHPEVHRQGDQPCLGAVVQVALEAAQLGGRVVEGLGAGLGQHLDPLLERLGVTVGEQPAVHRGAGPHDRLDPEPPQGPGHDEHEQQHADQGRGRSRRCRPRAARPGRARSSGPTPSRRAAARAPPLRVGRYCGGHRRAEDPARHQAVPVRQPAGGRDGQQQHRDADHDDREAPKTALRTKSTRAGTASTSCAAAYAVIRSRLGGGSAVLMVRILPDSGARRGGAGTTSVGVLAPLTEGSGVNRMEHVPFTLPQETSCRTQPLATPSP